MSQLYILELTRQELMMTAGAVRKKLTALKNRKEKSPEFTPEPGKRDIALFRIGVMSSVAEKLQKLIDKGKEVNHEQERD